MTAGRKPQSPPRRASCGGLVALLLLVLAAFSLMAPAQAAESGGQKADVKNGKERSAAVDENAAMATAGNRRRRSPLLDSRVPPDVRTEVARYCWNISDAARDARYLRQKRRLEEMAARLEALIGRLEKRRREFETWVRRREDITRRMSTSMTRVYENMEPDVAAQQITHMEYAVAVALLAGMKPKKAAAILAEMDPRIAGRLVNVIVGRVAEAGEGQPGRRLLKPKGGAAEETN